MINKYLKSEFVKQLFVNCMTYDGGTNDLNLFLEGGVITVKMEEVEALMIGKPWWRTKAAKEFDDLMDTLIKENSLSGFMEEIEPCINYEKYKSLFDAGFGITYAKVPYLYRIDMKLRELWARFKLFLGFNL